MSVGNAASLFGSNCIAMEWGMEREALSIALFCQLHSISRSTYFNLRADGRAPREMRVGTRVLISREAAADWRRERETNATEGHAA